MRATAELGRAIAFDGGPFGAGSSRSCSSETATNSGPMSASATPADATKKSRSGIGVLERQLGCLALVWVDRRPLVAIQRLKQRSGSLSHLLDATIEPRLRLPGFFCLDGSECSR